MKELLEEEKDAVLPIDGLGIVNDRTDFFEFDQNVSGAAMQLQDSMDNLHLP